MPPGAFYSPTPLTEQVQLTTRSDFGAMARSPVWEDGLFHYRNVPFAKHLCVIIELHSIKIKKGKAQSPEPVGWAMLPVFADEKKREERVLPYVATGEFEIPVYQDRPPNSFIQDLEYESPPDALRKAVKSRRVKLYEHASICVRLVDYSRTGEYAESFKASGRTSRGGAKKGWATPSRVYMKLLLEPDWRDDQMWERYDNEQKSKPLSKELDKGMSVIDAQKLQLQAMTEHFNIMHYSAGT